MKSPFAKNFVLPPHFYDCKTSELAKVQFGGVSLLASTIYLDFASSTPLDIRVFHEMQPWMLGYFANPANRTHPFGELTEHAIAKARMDIAQILNLQFEEVIFTSSATESNNLLLRGLVAQPRRRRHKIVFCATEHSSIVETINALCEQTSFCETNPTLEAAPLPVDSQGQIDLEQASRVIDSSTLCVCVMDVNNETGIIQSTLPKIAEMTKRSGALLHVDSPQGFARASQVALGVPYDTLTLSSGKIYGPKGAAALIVKNRSPRIPLVSQMTGGGQEFSLRSGTVNTAAVVGFARACLLQQEEREERLAHFTHLENAFCDEIERCKDINAHIYGRGVAKAPGILSLYFPGVNAMKLLEQTPSVCASVGSACKTRQATSSHVLLAMGEELETSLASFRVSFGLTNSEEEVREGARRLLETARKLQKSSAVFLDLAPLKKEKKWI